MGLTERVLELISDQDESEKKNVKPIEKPELNLPRCLELPLGKPFYSTYHFQGITGAISLSNPSLRNWYLNESVSLCCERVFLYGFSSPHLNIVNSSWLDTPHIDKIIYPTRFLNELLNEDIHLLIRILLNHGYYVNFDGVDDYFLDGKSWNGKRHFCHDGLIYGYNLEDDTYNVYAYDNQWVYRGFKVKRESFDKGRYYMIDHGVYGTLCGAKPFDAPVAFDPLRAYENLYRYLNSSLNEYPYDGEGKVFGIVVHEYIAEYIDRLYHGLIQYDKMDWRLFRVVWEQKVFMLERLQKIEETLGLNSALSQRYQLVVSEANSIRMLYASHYRKRRDSVLPIIKEKLVQIYEMEKDILGEIVVKMQSSLAKEKKNKNV